MNLENIVAKTNLVNRTNENGPNPPNARIESIRLNIMIRIFKLVFSVYS